jgi:hypothetical protein
VHFKSIVNLDETAPHVVTGRLRVTYHPPTTIDEEHFEGFTEYRLEKAVFGGDR